MWKRVSSCAWNDFKRLTKASVLAETDVSSILFSNGPAEVFAVTGSGKGQRISVLETKGDQLDNLDTAYKREVLSFLSNNFKWDDVTTVGELELIKNSGETVRCTLILMSEWKKKLPTYL